MSYIRNKGIGISDFELSKEEGDLIYKNRDQIFCITLFSRNIKDYDLILNLKSKEFFEIQKLKLNGGENQNEIKAYINLFFEIDENQDLLFQINEKIKFFEEKAKNIKPKNYIGLYTLIQESKNCLKNLILSIKKIDLEIQIAIDHEGGIVNRFPWSRFDYKPASYFGNLYLASPYKAKAQMRTQAFIIANELKENNIDLDFTPVLDLRKNEFLKKRSFSDQGEIIFELSFIFIDELLGKNIKVCLKHLIGHGKSGDTHVEICHIKENRENLIAEDIFPFQKISTEFGREIKEGKILGMISHVIYDDIDPDYIASSSKKIVQFIKENISKDLILISDAIEMDGCIKFHHEFFTDNLPKTKMQVVNLKEVFFGYIKDNVLSSGINIVLLCSQDVISSKGFFEKK
jgi:beta-glucosidase-like glycosyl hydrolase